MKCFLPYIVCVIVPLASTAAATNENFTQSDNESKFVWTTDESLFGEGIASWDISPDSRWAVFILRHPDQNKNEYVGNLYLRSLTDDRQIQLTRGSDECDSPKWSFDCVSFFQA